MKFLIVYISLAIIVPNIAKPSRQRQQILSRTTNYSTEDGNERQEEFDTDGNIKGHYSYVDPSGKRIVVNYTAGIDGFKANGNHFANFQMNRANSDQSINYNIDQDGQYEIVEKPAYKSPSLLGYRKQQKHVYKFQSEDGPLSYVNQKTKITHHPTQAIKYKYQQVSPEFKIPVLSSIKAQTSIGNKPDSLVTFVSDNIESYLNQKTGLNNFEVKEVNEENQEDQPQQYFEGERENEYEEIRIPLTKSAQHTQLSEIEPASPIPLQTIYLKNNNQNDYREIKSKGNKYTNIFETGENNAEQIPLKPISEAEFENKYGKQSYDTEKFTLEDATIVKQQQQPQSLFVIAPEYKGNVKLTDKVKILSQGKNAGSIAIASNEKEIQEFLKNIDRQNKDEEERIRLLVKSYPASLAQYQEYIKGQQAEKLEQQTKTEQQNVQLLQNQQKILYIQSPAQNQEKRLEGLSYNQSHRRQSAIRPATTAGLGTYRTTLYKESIPSYQSYLN